MSYNSDVEIPIKVIPTNELRLELYKILLDYRPDDDGLIDCDGFVIQFPCSFSDNVYEPVYDFIKKHKLTITIKYTDDDDNESDLIFIDGELIDDD